MITRFDSLPLLTHVTTRSTRLSVRIVTALIALWVLTHTAIAQQLTAVDGDSADAAALLQLLNTPNHVAIMRHTLAPGTGDPMTVELGNCATQRNLSAEGREQARNAGALFKQHGIESAAVYSSQWCRCLDTATLMNLGTVTPLPVINSFFRDRQNARPQTEALAQWLVTDKPNQPTLLVTHQVNITALTGVYPQSGEVVIFRLDDPENNNPAKDNTQQNKTDQASDDQLPVITVVGRMVFEI